MEKLAYILQNYRFIHLNVNFLVQCFPTCGQVPQETAGKNQGVMRWPTSKKFKNFRQMLYSIKSAGLRISSLLSSVEEQQESTHLYERWHELQELRIISV